MRTVQLTEPFNDPIGFGSHIAQLSNLLAGEKKVILQTYSNFRDSKRTKHLYRVFPTLDKENYILGDVNLAFPRRIAESILDFIENLNSVIPGIANDDNLLYAPEIICIFIISNSLEIVPALPVPLFMPQPTVG